MTDKEIKFYDKRLFKINLALESYVDFYGVEPVGLDEVIEKHNKFRVKKDKMTDKDRLDNCKNLVYEYIKIIDGIGRDKFEFYDDGSVTCKWNH